MISYAWVRPSLILRHKHSSGSRPQLERRTTLLQSSERNVKLGDTPIPQTYDGVEPVKLKIELEVRRPNVAPYLLAAYRLRLQLGNWGDSNGHFCGHIEG